MQGGIGSPGQSHTHQGHNTQQQCSGLIAKLGRCQPPLAFVSRTSLLLAQ